MKGNDIPFPLNTATIYVQTKPLSPPVAPTNPTSTTSSLPFPQNPCVKVVSTTPPLAKPQRPQSTASSSAVETSHPMSVETVCQQQPKKLLSNTALQKKWSWYGTVIACYATQTSHSSPPCSKLPAFLCITFKI